MTFEGSVFHKAFEDIQPEMAVIKLIFEARERGISKQELSERTGLSEQDIADLEWGTKNLTLDILRRLADGLDMTLNLNFIPRKT